MTPQNAGPNNNQISIQHFSEDKTIRRRQQLLCLPEVVEKLNQVDNIVANASISEPIKSFPMEVLIEKIKPLTGGIFKDIGLRAVSELDLQYRQTRFTDMLTKYYSQLSLASVKLAFELLLIGELDEYLPTDRNGNPEKNHYQDFSVEYYTRVLNAFIKKQQAVWYKAGQSQPRLENRISEVQRSQNRNMIIEYIYDAFDNYKDHKIVPSFDLAFTNVLVENGLIEIKEPTEKSTREAYNKLLVIDYLTRIEKSKMIDEYSRNKINHTLRYNAQTVENDKTIQEYFDKLISLKIDIREELKKT